MSGEPFVPGPAFAIVWIERQVQSRTQGLEAFVRPMNEVLVANKSDINSQTGEPAIPFQEGVGINVTLHNAQFAEGQPIDPEDDGQLWYCTR